MRKSLVLAAVLFVLLMVTGFASREWQAAADSKNTVVPPHEAHLEVYEEIRPSLLDRRLPLGMLCGSHRADSTGMQ